MKEIQHQFIYAVSIQDLYLALTTSEGIQGWWTNHCTLGSEVGDQSVFQWPDYGWKVEVRIQTLKTLREIVWQCTQSNMQNTSAWVGTQIRFQLTSLDSKKCQLDFTQGPYPESSCYLTCVDGWKYFLGTSLKSYLETGVGKPYRG